MLFADPQRRDRHFRPLRPDPADPGAAGRYQRPGVRVQGLRPRLGGDGRRVGRKCVRRFAKVNLHAFRRRCSTNGYRTTSPPAPRQSTAPTDLKGFKIRGAGVALWTSMFKAFGASTGVDQLRRGVFRLADQGCRGTGKSLGIIVHRKALRSAEIFVDDRPHVGRLLCSPTASAGLACRKTSRTSSPNMSTTPPSSSATTSGV